MSLADELRKLQELRDGGTLSAEEFAQAKASLLEKPTRNPLGDAARMWVTYRIVTTIIGLILAAIFFFGFFLPRWNQEGRLP